MMNTRSLKESFEIQSKHEAFYTGGNVELSEDGEVLFCQNTDFIALVTVSKGSVKLKLGKTGENEEDDPINSFTASNDGKFVVTHHKSSLFKLWNTSESKPVKIWKSIHNGPVASLALTKDALNMASGGIDGSIRLWDLNHHVCTHNLKDAQGVVSLICYYPNAEKNLIFASADDCAIHAWNLKTGERTIKLNGHCSKVTSLTFHDDDIHAVSSGRDKVLILWDIIKKVSIRILPVFENIETSCIIPDSMKLPVQRKEENSPIYAASAGEKGIVKIWELKTGAMVYEQHNSLIPAAKEENGLSIKYLMCNKVNNWIGIVSTSHNILIHTLDTFECKKQLIGYMDEVLDIAFLGNEDSYLAVATNSSDIKLYELATMNSQILCGHSNIVLSLGTTLANRDLLLSSDKDNCIRLWSMDEKAKTMVCKGVGKRHTAAVGCVAFSQVETKFFVSVSQDSCLKLWDMPVKLDGTETFTLNVVHTVTAHQKDINSVTISPNDKLIATGSQDKTAKLWSADNLQQLGVFRGHRRGVWKVKFSPIDQVLATSSADCTIKLWSLTELNCLKTFEGHESAVLYLEFLSRGMQILSSGADGLIKLWNIKTAECNSTLDQHNNRVWSLALNHDETHFVSGGSDSLLVIWRDTTQEKKNEQLALQEEIMRDEEKLANSLQAEKLTKALKLALKLQKPLHVLRIIESLVKKGEDDLTATICELKPAQQEELLRNAVTWNTNARNFQIAQLVINSILKEIGLENLSSTDLKEKLESMIPYTDRHFKRLTRLYQDLHLLSYTINNMKSLVNDAESTNM